MRVALDTNVLAYAEGIDDPTRHQLAMELIGQLDDASTFLPVQVLGELFNVLRKARYSVPQAQTIVLRWQKTCLLIETSTSVLLSAIDLATGHGLKIWDAVILAAAAEADCRLLLSEDMQDGFTWRGVTVANPFAAKKNELVAELFK